MIRTVLLALSLAAPRPAPRYELTVSGRIDGLTMTPTTSVISESEARQWLPAMRPDGDGAWVVESNELWRERSFQLAYRLRVRR